MDAPRRGTASRHSIIAAFCMLIVSCSAPVVPPTPSPTPSATNAPTPTRSPEPTPTSVGPPTSTPTRAPTSSPPPSPLPTPTPPSPSAAAGALVIDEADIARHLDALAAIAEDHGGIRPAGTSGYDASADYVAGQLRDLGYAVTEEAVDFTFFDEREPVTLTVGTETWSGPEHAHAMLYSAGGEVSGRLDVVGQIEPIGTQGCERDDWNRFREGRIAVVFSGPCFRRDQVVQAQAAGAVGLIGAYPWAAGEILRPTLLEPDGIEIPAIAVGTTVSPLLVGAPDATVVDLSVAIETSPASDGNVIGEWSGTTDSVLMLGGHLDSVLDGPGINDNGSGVATLLAIAEALAAQPPPDTTVRFAFWAAEEFGVHGSSQYVDNLAAPERDRIDAYINLDMVGSPNAGRYVYDDSPGGDRTSDITQAILNALEDIGAPGVGIPSGGSDHVAFWQAGIPFGGVFSGIAPLTDAEAALFGGEANVPADPCYHLACDDRSNVDTATALVVGQAIAAALEELAY